MPTYRVKAPDGRTVKVTGDSPPTEADLDAIFSQIAPKAVAEAPEAPPKPEGSAGARFAGGVWSQVNPVTIVKGLATAVSSPVQTLRGAAEGMGQEWEKAGQNWMQGRYSEALGHGVAGSIPFVGPAAAAAGERIGSGDVAGGLGEGAGMLASAGIPAALKAGAGAVSPLVNRARAPFAVDPKVVAAAERVAASGGQIDLPASALSASKVVPLLETVAAKGVGGGGTAARFSGAMTALTSRAEHLVASAGKLATASERGVAIAKGLADYRSHWMKVKGALYKDAAVPNIKVDAPRALQATREILGSKKAAARVVGSAGDLGLFQMLKDKLASGTLTGSEAHAAIRELNAKIGGAHADAWSAANKQALKKVAAALDDDFRQSLKTQAPDIAAKLEAADTAYKSGLARINSSFGKSITKLARAGEYDKIGDVIANARMSADMVPAILDTLGPEGATAVRTTILADIVTKAKGASGQLTPQGLARSMTRYGDDILTAALDPDQLAKLKDLSTLSESMQKGIKVMEGSQSAPLLRAGAIGGLAFSNPVVALKFALGDVAFNRFVSSKFGQRWLGKGFSPVRAPDINRPWARAASLGGTTVADQTSTGRD